MAGPADIRAGSGDDRLPQAPPLEIAALLLACFPYRRRT
jgi:hypothetical protein